MKTFEISSVEELNEVAAYLLNHAEHRILAMYGEMGAGKTSLSIDLCKALGVEDQISSPTFALVNEYRTKNEIPVFHFDFYRINHVEEAIDMGFYEYVDQNAWCLIEWPEHIESILPENRTNIRFEFTPHGRKLTIESYDGKGRV